ncbi:MAG: hypothetical protein HQK55_01875 [Deltaproteobacteria bacterium]|nr:hypothetical protein [Deltaproteobacteria bacterium]
MTNLNIRPNVNDEAEIISLQGGEIPEVALYDSLNYLIQNGLDPTTEEKSILERAVADRYRKIIARDLNHDYINKSFFRTPRRAWINTRRLAKFAVNRQLELNSFTWTAGHQLLDFLHKEAQAIASGQPKHHLGLTQEELRQFLAELHLIDQIDHKRIETIFSVPPAGQAAPDH